jgi:hypothetical protein
VRLAPSRRAAAGQSATSSTAPPVIVALAALISESSKEGTTMSGRSRLPGGAARKASQRQCSLSAPRRVVIERSWRAGDKVAWRDRSGTYQRDVGDGLVDIDIAGRTYRVLKTELRAAGP